MFSVIFPGQGSQSVGMAKEFYDRFGIFKKIFYEADDILNFPISKLILEGPKDKLNLTQNNISEKKISLSSKEKINKELKTLSKDEIIEIKENIKSKKKEKIAKKLINKKNIVKSQSLKKEEIKQIKKNKSSKNIVTRKKILNEKRQIVDVCTIIEKCSIEEISKYLIKQGKKKGYPDITRRQ